jgi:hypothetical protein
VYVHLDHLVHSPTSFIHEVECHCGAPLFRLAASSHDASVMVFESAVERERVSIYGHHCVGGQLSLA